MTQLFAFVPKFSQSQPLTREQAEKLLKHFKLATSVAFHDLGYAQIALAPRIRDESIPWFTHEESIWMTWSGTWFHRHGQVEAMDGKGLIQRYLEIGAEQLGKELEGQFAILIGDARTRNLHILTDRCSNLHFFIAESPQGYAVSSSSAMLAGWLEKQQQKIDPVGLHQFIATGIIFDSQTLWLGVKKIQPGSVYSIHSEGVNSKRYWHFSDLNPERLGIDAAAEQIHAALLTVLARIAKLYPRIISDLTGGYDSRMLLAGLLSAQVGFETTVSGPSDSPDVIIARTIADSFSIPHETKQVGECADLDAVTRAMLLTDGEYDAFEYSRIAAVQTLSSQKHQITLNGSFGELARGYWWELIWPNLTERSPLNGEIISRKRFAALPYDRGIFSPTGQLDLVALLGDILNRTIQDLHHFPKTTQMDALYYYQRMQHWQGRIVSSTNQIWPCLSPFCFAGVLEPILEAKAETRIRSYLPRVMFERFNPKLASIPLEHGYPPRPFSLRHGMAFLPILSHYGHLVGNKLAAKLPLRTPKPSPRVSPPMAESFPEIFDYLSASPLRLLETGCFDEKQLQSWFSPQANLSGHKLNQWKRLVTVELLLRKLAEFEALSAGISP